MKNTLKETKNSLIKTKRKAVISNTICLALLIGAISIATPLIKSHFQHGQVDKIEMVSIQEDTANFIKLNTVVVNYANTTLGDICNFVQSGFSEKQREIILVKKYGLTEYKHQLSSTNPSFFDLTKNTNHKLTILLSAIDYFLDLSSTTEQDRITLNTYINEYKLASDKEQQLLISLLNYAGMKYEMLPDGQIKYTYLKMTKG